MHRPRISRFRACPGLDPGSRRSRDLLVRNDGACFLRSLHSSSPRTSGARSGVSPQPLTKAFGDLCAHGEAPEPALNSIQEPALNSIQEPALNSIQGLAGASECINVKIEVAAAAESRAARFRISGTCGSLVRNDEMFLFLFRHPGRAERDPGSRGCF